MLVKEIMSKRLVAVSPNDTISGAAELMQRHDIGTVLVCDSDGLRGVVTDRDIVVRCVSAGKNTNSKVSDIMTSSPVSISPESTSLEAARLMAQEQVRRLPVVDDDRVVGIVSLGDMARAQNLDVEVAVAIADISETKECHRMKK